MQFEIIEDLVKDDHKVVYDCMDDLLELPGNSSNIFFRKRLLKYESRLLNRCNLVLASSNYLGDKLIERYGDIKNLHIVNNAIDIDVGMTVEGRLPSGLPQETTNIFSDINFLKLVYIGTISEWLDFNLIFESLKQFSNICYIFVGPNLLSVKHERIFFCGAVEHNKIYEIMNMADVLIMPFIVNELVKSVNPVKLYEYIYSCKPVISVKYDETLQFEDYVYLYSSETEYLQLISMSVNGNLPSKNSEHENKEFAYKNNWSNRTSTIKALLLQLCDNNVEI
jgi:glycosyltransferase involved in cell wall biosynthesis